MAQILPIRTNQLTVLVEPTSKKEIIEMLIRRKNTAPYIKDDTNMYIKNNIIHVCANTGNANSFHKCLCFPMNNLQLKWCLCIISHEPSHISLWLCKNTYMKKKWCTLNDNKYFFFPKLENFSSFVKPVLRHPPIILWWLSWTLFRYLFCFSRDFFPQFSALLSSSSQQKWRFFFNVGISSD